MDSSVILKFYHLGRGKNQWTALRYYKLKSCIVYVNDTIRKAKYILNKILFKI